MFVKETFRVGRFILHQFPYRNSRLYNFRIVIVAYRDGEGGVGEGVNFVNYSALTNSFRFSFFHRYV